MEVNIEPLEYRVLVLPDEVSKFHDESGLIEKSTGDYKMEVRAQTKGTIAALSKVAFKHDWYGTKPKVGDRIEYAMNAGQYYYIEDTLYRIMNDQDIIGLLKESK